MRSMTGFGAAAVNEGDFRVAARVRTVNHRNLDLVLRVPEEYRVLETRLREAVGQRLHRGRVEVRLEVEDRRERPVSVDLNASLIEALKQARAELAASDLELDPLRFSDLLRLPDALRITTGASEVDGEAASSILKVVDQALQDLETSRAQEGDRLTEILTAQVEALGLLVEQTAADQEGLRIDQGQRLRSRIDELIGDRIELDEGRLEQEIAYLAERADVREEIDRLVGHLAHFEATMKLDGAVGKKLDFIAQEMARELSTLGAKCRQAGVLDRNIDAKLICEQIREQVQNIE